jgi:hypothetical protein
MRRVVTVMTAVVAAVTLSSMVFAQTAPAKAEKAMVKSERTVKVVKTLAARGKVAKYDEATKVLTVTTKAGEKEFTLGADTKITAGAKTATTEDLAGKTVKVTYTVVEGKDVASKVTIAAEPVSKKVVKEPAAKAPAAKK